MPLSRCPCSTRCGTRCPAVYQRSFDSIGCNYYRTGADSVAWHGDRMRHEQIDPLVAIVSVGAPRPFQLRPRGGGHALSFLLGQGDLLVMGGAIQHDWEHSVPKVAAAGPRISITYRHGAESPAALRAVRSRHPAAGAQNRHRAATGSTNAPGRLSASGADRRERHGPPWPAGIGRTPLMNALLSIGTIVGAVLLLLLVTATVAAALLDV